MVKITMVPVQTDRGVTLYVSVDGKEPVALDIGDEGEPIHLELPLHVQNVDPDDEAMEKKSRKKRIRRIRAQSQRQEDRIAQEVGGWRQIASGALPGRKGDVYVDGVLRFEVKGTYAASYPLEAETLHKATLEAKAGEIPAVIVELLDANGRSTDSLAITHFADLARLVHADHHNQRSETKRRSRDLEGTKADRKTR